MLTNEQVDSIKLETTRTMEELFVFYDEDG
jgi:hypothetical protein